MRRDDGIIAAVEKINLIGLRGLSREKKALCHSATLPLCHSVL